MNTWDLSQNGYGNVYYAAAVRSMTQSWHNFFFVSFDPGGFISVDKPPVFLWIDAASARLFGYSSWSLLLPSVVAGAAAVALLWLLLRRYFGLPAATIAALVLALTPGVVVISRLNQPEPFYVLALMGAAACVLRSLEGGRWWSWTAAASLLVGVAFNTKMLAGWVPGPALALAIVVGVEGGWRLAWRQWLPRLAVLGAVTLVASASWMLVVDTWPASARPYVGGSSNNSVRDLILDYNGLGRVERKSSSSPSIPPPKVLNPAPKGSTHEADESGTLRLFNSKNGGHIAWFLPFAVMGGVVGLWRWRDQRLLRAAIVLWLGWLLLEGVVFSYMQGTYHSYYTSAMAPGVAALAGIGAVAISQSVGRHRAWLIAGAAMALVTVWVQLEVSGRPDDFFIWLRPLLVIVVTAGLGFAVASAWQPRQSPLAGMAVVVLGLLLMPAAWSGYEAAHAPTSAAFPRVGPRVDEGLVVNGTPPEGETAAFVSLIESLRDEWMVWDLIVDDAQDAAFLIVNYDLSVLPLGGYEGHDSTLTVGGFAGLVASGKARFVLPTTGFAPSPAASVAAVFSAVRAVCEPVTGLIAPIHNLEADALYDCAGRAEQLAAR